VVESTPASNRAPPLPFEPPAAPPLGATPPAFGEPPVIVVAITPALPPLPPPVPVCPPLPVLPPVSAVPPAAKEPPLSPRPPPEPPTLALLPLLQASSKTAATKRAIEAYLSLVDMEILAFNHARAVAGLRGTLPHALASRRNFAEPYGLRSRLRRRRDLANW